MMAGDLPGLFQVGQGSRHLEDAVGGAQGQVQALAGVFKPGAVGGVQGAVPTQALQVEERVGAALPLKLKAPCPSHFGRGLRTARAYAGRWLQAGGFAGDGQVQIDSVEQGAGQLGAVALNLFWGAAAAATGVTQISTGAWVHRRHQLEARREAHLVMGAGDDDFATFQRLTQNFQHLPVELWHLAFCNELSEIYRVNGADQKRLLLGDSGACDLLAVLHYLISTEVGETANDYPVNRP